MERLELHTDAMRATDAGNAERLAYNRRVLTERASENAAALTQHARRLSKQRDALAELKARESGPLCFSREHTPVQTCGRTPYGLAAQRCLQAAWRPSEIRRILSLDTSNRWRSNDLRLHVLGAADYAIVNIKKRTTEPA